MYEITEGKHTRRREETGGPQFFSAAPVKPNSITGAEASENSRRPPERKSGREIPIKMKHELTQRCLKGFEAYLQEEERSGATREKYLRDLRAFQRFWRMEKPWINWRCSVIKNGWCRTMPQPV